MRWRFGDQTGSVPDGLDDDALVAMLMMETGEDNIKIKREGSVILVCKRMQVREMPDDNSCLFHAFCHLIPELTNPQQVRQMVAQLVYDLEEAILGKSADDYAAWILSDDSWGGAIEIMLLARAYDLCVRVVDVQSGGRIEEFNPTGGKLAYLLYSGIHYDLIEGQFEPSDTWHRGEAIKLAREAKALHQYTDVANFTLLCDICQAKLTGQKAAQQHAKATGHFSFSESRN